MSPSNREVQLRKTCKLYAYVLISLGKEVPEEIQECVDSEDYDYLVDCVAELAQTLRDLDPASFDQIVNNTESTEARDLAQWWDMYQIYIPV